MPNYLGQHFLKNASVVKKIVAALDIQNGETIIEVGPGHGELTIPLAAAAQKVGAKIIAVEKDKKLADGLASRIKIEKVENVEIVNIDILEFLETTPHALSKLVGNIPYYLTGHLLRIVSELAIKPARVVLMIQKEVAERICAEPPWMNRLAASVQFWGKPKIIASVPRADFSPPPEVDSAVIALETKNFDSEMTSDQYYEAVRTLFAQPRKTILNNLSAKLPKNDAETILSRLGIDPKLRPQNLTIENITQLAKNL